MHSAPPAVTTTAVIQYLIYYMTQDMECVWEGSERRVYFCSFLPDLHQRGTRGIQRGGQGRGRRRPGQEFRLCSVCIGADLLTGAQREAEGPF